MPQIFNVLRCYKCSAFQVHQAKKSNKFQCKVCGEKQSIKRHYGVGTAKDCRVHVQRLNGMRGDIDELKGQLSDNSDSETINEIPEAKVAIKQESKQSKWSDFVDDVLQEENDNESMSLGDAEVVLEIPKRKRKQFNKNYCSKHMKYSKYHNKKRRNEKLNDEDSENDDPEHYENDMNIQPTSCHSQAENITVQKPIINHIVAKPIPKKKFIPPVLNKHSKWAQFSENISQNNGEEFGTLPQNFMKSEDSLSNTNLVFENNSYVNFDRNNKVSKSITKPQTNLTFTKHLDQNERTKLSKNKFTPPALIKCSKWAEFVKDESHISKNDDEDQYLMDSHEEIENSYQNDVDDLFENTEHQTTNIETMNSQSNKVQKSKLLFSQKGEDDLDALLNF